MRESADGPERAERVEQGEPPGRTTTSVPATAARGRPAAARLIGLQRAAGNRAVAGLLGPARPGTAPIVIQRVAAQLAVSPDGKTITDLTVRGRPASPYTDTMGDHTTAFIVQATAVRNAVLNKSLADAVAGVRGLVDRAMKLPGIARVPKLPKGGGVGHGDKFEAAKVTMDGFYVELNEVDVAKRNAAALDAVAVASGTAADRKNADDAAADRDLRESRSMTTLQNLVTAYLQFREFIPLSTLNIRAINPAKAGKGKGESRHAKILAASDATTDKLILREAILGLLDPNGLAMLMAESDPGMARKVAPAVALRDRTDPILLQHLHAVDAAYPGMPNRVWANDKEALDDLRAYVAPVIEAEYKANVDTYNKILLTKYEELATVRQNQALEAIEKPRSHKTALAKEKAGKDARAATALAKTVADEEAAKKKAADRKTKADAWDTAAAEARAKGLPPPEKEVELSDDEESPVDDRTLMNAREVAEAEVAKLTRLIIANKGVPIPEPPPPGSTDRTAENAAKKRKAEEDEAAAVLARAKAKEDAKAAAKARAKAAKVGVGAHSAVQLVLDGAGKIAELNIEGRPPSAFTGGKMGAHTTAWIVHKDVIRTAILKRTVPEAIGRLPGLGVGVDELQHRLRRFGAGSTSETMKSVMDKNAADAAAAPLAAQPILLQAAINKLLERVNVLPGVAFDAGDTGGDREGGLRAELLAFETTGLGATPEKLEGLLMGMLDRSSVGDPVDRLTLLKNHLILVEKAYPVSYAASRIAGVALNVLEKSYPDKADRKDEAVGKKRKTG
ncbi:hypothetical protein [Phytomonospora endophytica]|uniref:Uncharacterized protein n=1 Tax=Phytomonospora endophytica TaxID=714109 RepID=A0A841FPL8_9ACTN|nr:hypothetical protein [Phytomonospora endophytica]MBB6037774.1 hypothetical protein [Phytomonospora endophytica]GIG67696.1 hypothetical protein Pen01_39910 [Phytomonospora endophytica]